MFENQKKKVSFKIGDFLKPEACGQTVLPDMSILIGQKLVEMENAEIKIGFLTLLS